MPMPRSSIGECVPEVTSPPSAIAIPWRGIALVLHDEGDELARRPLGLDPAQLLDPGELLVERADPAEAGGDRVRLRADVVAVQRVADLEPERVAGAEAARRRAAREDGVPERARRPRP